MLIIATVLEALASRYINANPPKPHVFRVINREGIGMDREGGYRFNLDERFPGVPVGSHTFAWAKVWSDKETKLPLAIRCRGPVRVVVNGEVTFRSWHQLETVHHLKSEFAAPLRQGWNHIVMAFEKTEIGFGCVMGSAFPRWVPFHVLTPSAEREGGAGWLYSEPTMESNKFDELVRLTAELGAVAESDTGIGWFPRMDWNEQELAAGQLERMFGKQDGAVAYGWSRWRSVNGGSIRMNGNFKGSATIYVDGVPVGLSAGGSTDLSFPVGMGEHDLVIRSVCDDPESWGFELHLTDDSGCEIPMVKPGPVLGMTGEWLYAGPFPNDAELEPTLYGLPEWDGVQVYWRLNHPGQQVRPYTENALYGKWNYPLGVTLYGLMRAGEALAKEHWYSYAWGHMEQCTSMYRYSVWDARQYGTPSVNHQLATMDMLDDCGSSGAALLTAMQERIPEGAEKVVQDIAEYISSMQERLPDGSFFRKPPGIPFMENTLWADDLYMSTPFLIRNYSLTKDSRYLEDAVLQFRNYRKYLFLPELKVMSHVYFADHGKANGIPWGRGNGWTLFSLSELLEVLPDAHEAREELLHQFRLQCQGYLALQGQRGLWHNLLTDSESFEESSCTAMFIYAFARGIRFSWLEDAEGRYRHAVERGWEGLCKHMIDSEGNLYGVCQGSGYSFSPTYYKSGLRTITNDTHGIGIVLLAGVEVMNLYDL